MAAFLFMFNRVSSTDGGGGGAFIFVSPGRLFFLFVFFLHPYRMFRIPMIVFLSRVSDSRFLMKSTKCFFLCEPAEVVLF